MTKFNEAGRGMIVISAITLVLVVVFATSPATAKDKNKSIEQYQANAIATAPGASSMVEINIYRWSSDEERAEILDVIKTATEEPRAHRNRAVAKALRGQEKAGYVFFAGRQGWPLRYAREFEVEGERQIILATDRPVSFGEVYSNSQLGDFDVSVIVLKVDDSGKGEGIASVGTEVKWDEASGKLDVTNVTSQPMKLGNVRPAK